MGVRLSHVRDVTSVSLAVHRYAWYYYVPLSKATALITFAEGRVSITLAKRVIYRCITVSAETSFIVFGYSTVENGNGFLTVVFQAAVESRTERDAL